MTPSKDPTLCRGISGVGCALDCTSHMMHPQPWTTTPTTQPIVISGRYALHVLLVQHGKVCCQLRGSRGMPAASGSAITDQRIIRQPGINAPATQQLTATPVHQQVFRQVLKSEFEPDSVQQHQPGAGNISSPVEGGGAVGVMVMRCPLQPFYAASRSAAVALSCEIAPPPLIPVKTERRGEEPPQSPMKQKVTHPGRRTRKRPAGEEAGGQERRSKSSSWDF